MMDFSNTHILVIGDLMLDEYISTSIKRISPEAPVPVANLKDRWCVLGGAANVAKNLSNLGCKVTACGLQGKDQGALQLSKLLEENNITNQSFSSPFRSTTQKTRITAQGGQQLLRLDQEDASPLLDEEFEAIAKKISDIIPVCQAVILSDYAKGVFLTTKSGFNLATFAIDLAKKNNIYVLVDPKGTDWTKYSGASCLTPNTAEVELVSGRSLPNRTELTEALQVLMDTYGLERILVTRSEKGMALFEQNNTPIFIKAKAKEVVDVSGAGDTVISVLAACKALGNDWGKSAEYSNLAAGEVVSKAGTSPISKNEFDSLFEPGRNSPKIMELKELVDCVARWKRMGNSIVFTNGCFDLLHKGHIKLLKEAAAQGDRLIVALNSDASVAKVKGPGRPVQDEASRALLVASLSGVDAVILFESDTPISLLEALKPNVLVKGSDYTQETVVGAEIVRKYGGSIYFVEIVDEVSVSSLVSKMAKKY